MRTTLLCATSAMDVLGLLAETHPGALRRLCFAGACHSAGIHQALRRVRDLVPLRMQKKLKHLEFADCIARHLTVPGCTDFSLQTERALVAPALSSSSPSSSPPQSAWLLGQLRANTGLSSASHVFGQH